MRGTDRRKPGGLVLSLDFELMWGMNRAGSLVRRREQVLGARRVIPRLLDLFERHGIGCTWATVGFLFCRDRDELLASIPPVIPAYRDRNLSNYSYLDEVGADERRDPLHFAPSLIQRIAERPDQEIGTHTLSHFYCLEDGPSVLAFRADLDAALRLASAAGYSMRSIAFPRNQVSSEALAVCRQLGLSVYRGVGRLEGSPGVARSREGPMRRAMRFVDAYVGSGSRRGPAITAQEGMIEVPASLFLRPFSRATAIGEPLKIHRILSAMRRAAIRGDLFHLWFHPENFGVNQEENLAMMTVIAAEAQRLRDRYDWPTLNMSAAAAYAKVGAFGAGGAADECRPTGPVESWIEPVGQTRT